MANELKDICDKLAGFDPEKSYEVLTASRREDGKWLLVVKKISCPQEQEVAEDADQ